MTINADEQYFQEICQAVGTHVTDLIASCPKVHLIELRNMMLKPNVPIKVGQEWKYSAIKFIIELQENIHTRVQLMQN